MEMRLRAHGTIMVIFDRDLGQDTLSFLDAHTVMGKIPGGKLGKEIDRGQVYFHLA